MLWGLLPEMAFPILTHQPYITPWGDGTTPDFSVPSSITRVAIGGTKMTPIATWRAMLVQHPPLTKVTVYNRASSRSPSRARTFTYDEGVRYGALADLAVWYGQRGYQCLWVDQGTLDSREEIAKAQQIAHEAESSLLLYCESLHLD